MSLDIDLIAKTATKLSKLTTELARYMSEPHLHSEKESPTIRVVIGDCAGMEMDLHITIRSQKARQIIRDAALAELQEQIDETREFLMRLIKQ